ncbi:hypothetical protein DFJ73DRAFT_893971 [Zopfochytrium polystomum]|nr:hypothetical protein DFJ73DRAFT_893971 [Zopfochytrium polystomum]
MTTTTTIPRIAAVAATIVIAIALTQSFAPHNAAMADECADVLTHTISATPNSTVFHTIPVSAALACMKSFPVTPSLRAQQSAAVKSYYQFYPLLDAAKSSANPLIPWKSDLFARLDAAVANNASLTTEYALQGAIRDAVRALGDAKADYLPQCFVGQFFAFLPFVLATQQSGGLGPARLVVRETFTRGSALFKGLGNGEAARAHADALDGAYWRPGLGGKLPSEFVGFVVQSIDGVDALAFADRDAASRHPDARLNAALAGYGFANGRMAAVDGSFYYRYYLPQDMPDAHNMVLADPKTGATLKVSAKWAVLASDWSIFTSNAGYYAAAGCTPRGAAAASAASIASASSATTAGGVGRKLAAAVAPNADDNAAAAAAPAAAVAVTADLPRVSPPASHYAQFPSPATRRAMAAAVAGVRSGGASDARPVSDTELDALLPPAAAAAAASNTSSSQQQHRRRATIDPSTPFFASNDMAFYQLDASTGVWVLHTFYTTDGFDNWMANITAGLGALERANVSQLLIDVSSNIFTFTTPCLASAAATYLFPPSTSQQQRAVTYDLRATAAVTDLIKSLAAAAAAGGVPVDPDNAPDPVFVPSSFKAASAAGVLDPGAGFVRGGVKGRYTNRLAWNCDAEVAAARDASRVRPLAKGWPGKKVAVVSNGVCGGTCGVFVRTLRALNGVKSLVYGGASLAPFPATTAESGATALNFDDIWTYDVAAVPASPQPRPASLPAGPIPLPVMTTLPIANAYAPGTDTAAGNPMDFVADVADAWIGGGGGGGQAGAPDAADFVGVWRAAAARLAKG